jgi:hypothetical protein
MRVMSFGMNTSVTRLMRPGTQRRSEQAARGAGVRLTNFPE